MFLLDTSAWIEFLRRKGHPETKRFIAELLNTNSVVVTDPVWYELLCSSNKESRGNASRCLSLCVYIPFVLNHWQIAAELSRALASKGLVIPYCDVYLSAFSLSENITLVTRDAHFAQIRDCCAPNLKLYNQ